MGIIKQTVVCVIIGVVLLGCEASGNETLRGFSDKAKYVILKEYSMSEVKETYSDTIKKVKNLKDNTVDAVEYTEETMKQYRT